MEGLAGYVIFLTEIDSRPYLKDIKCPMMILAPTASTACPKAESEFVKDKVEQASLVWAESLGHEIFDERLSSEKRNIAGNYLHPVLTPSSHIRNNMHYKAPRILLCPSA